MLCYLPYLVTGYVFLFIYKKNIYIFDMMFLQLYFFKN